MTPRARAALMAATEEGSTRLLLSSSVPSCRAAGGGGAVWTSGRPARALQASLAVVPHPTALSTLSCTPLTMSRASSCASARVRHFCMRSASPPLLAAAEVEGPPSGACTAEPAAGQGARRAPVTSCASLGM